MRELRARYPGVPAVAYVNTYADVKAEVDICCTSSNAAAVVESLHSDTVIFLPDEYLARNVAKETGRHIIFPTLQQGKSSTTLDYQQVGNPDTMIGWHGRCEVHEKFTVKDIEAVRQQFPRGGRSYPTRVQPGGGGGLRFFGQHQRHDPLRARDERSPVPGAHRVCHG